MQSHTRGHEPNRNCLNTFSASSFKVIYFVHCWLYAIGDSRDRWEAWGESEREITCSLNRIRDVAITWYAPQTTNVQGHPSSIFWVNVNIDFWTQRFSFLLVTFHQTIKRLHQTSCTESGFYKGHFIPSVPDFAVSSLSACIYDLGGERYLNHESIAYSTALIAPVSSARLLAYFNATCCSMIRSCCILRQDDWRLDFIVLFIGYVVYMIAVDL